MNQTISTFAQHIGLPLSAGQVELLERYAGLVWQKKDFLNLTSAADVQEIYARHICDGLTAAAKINGLIHAKKVASPQVADVGAGAGYIGITVALALPEIQVTLVESIEKRCSFMNWALMQLGIKNAKVKQARLGQGTSFQFDFVTERAMGQLPDILEICLGALKPGGVFIAFQGEHPQADMCHPEKYQGILLGVELYTLPDDNKKRHLALFGRI